MIGGKHRTVGSRAEVWHGTAKKTSGGLTKSHLMKNKNGRIVSRKKHNTAKKDNRLVKAGYGTRKGKFGYVKIGKMGKSRKQRGGISGMRYNLEPSEYDGEGVGTSGDAVQFEAGMSGGKRKKTRRRRH